MAKSLSGWFSLAKNVNKARGEYEEEREEGIVEEPISELSLSISDDDLIELKNKWEKRWENSKVKKDIEAKQEENEKYWLGDHYTPAQKKTHKRESVDNLIFEAVETFLPVATRQIAQPLIETVEEPVAQMLARKVADKIVDVADLLRLRLKVKKAVRYWAIYFLGVLKFGWSMEKNEMVIQAVRPQQLILDPDAITDECEYEGEYLGHYRTDSLRNLKDRFGEKAGDIETVIGKENLGAKIRYVEWWTSEMVFWTLKDIVLGKSKNPHWNYDQEAQREVVNEIGEVNQVTDRIRGNNHFSQKKIPFAFLSVFNLGKSPYDDTNLIEQVVPLQDIINKRVRQIDKNADNTNGGIVVSGDVFSKEQAREVVEARRRGEAVFIPRGDVNRSYKHDVAPSLPQFIYQHLTDARNEVRNVFGTSGLSSQGIKSEETVRGKILIKGTDTDRAALIVDHIEQLYDYVFNWMIQLMVVYYDTPRPISRMRANETISSDDFVWPLSGSVKEGSLIPKDRLSLRNEAVELWQAQAIDPLTLAERLEVPDPEEYVRRLVLWKANPLALLKGGQQFQATPPAEEEEQPQEPVEANLLESVPIR